MFERKKHHAQRFEGKFKKEKKKKKKFFIKKKPENLLLSDDSENANVILADFGLAMKFNPGEKVTSPVGTPQYISPVKIKKSLTKK